MAGRIHRAGANLLAHLKARINRYVQSRRVVLIHHRRHL
jgi:hypothetical protein